MCTMYGCSTVLELLCKRGADTNIADKVRALSLVEILLDKGAEMNTIENEVQIVGVF